MPRCPVIATISLIVLVACLVGFAATASATPDRVKVGPDLYLQSAGAAPDRADRRRSEPSRPAGGRIVGGSATTIADYPWQAAIAYDETIAAGSGYERQFCGGTLVAPQVMITAAHCVYDNTTPGFGPPAHYETFTGRTFLSSSEGQVIEWSDYYYFQDGLGRPLFNPVTFDYDAIFVVLASASTSPSVKVAGADEAATWAAGRTARISGWGDQASGANAYPDQLRAAQVQIIGDHFCANPASYGPNFHAQLMLCAGVPGSGGVDTCQGDSGGPIVVPVSERGRGTFRLVGDTSWGIGCAEAQYPGIYARIAGGTTMGNALQSAIQSITGQNVYGSGARPLEVPKVRITKAPKNTTKARRGRKRTKVTFKFTSNEPTATFSCELDGKRATRCKSPHRLKVKKGRHRMQIVATNFLGETGAAATDRFRVRLRRR